MRPRDKRIEAKPPPRLYVKYDCVGDVVFIWAGPAHDHLIANRSSMRVISDEPLIKTMLLHIQRGEEFITPCSSTKHAEDIIRRLEVMLNEMKREPLGMLM